jgi:Fe-S-cluster-containing hydrogenase component 2
VKTHARAIVDDNEKCFSCRVCEVRCPELTIKVVVPEVLKVEPPPDYPPEEGRYLQGNDLSSITS